MGTDKSFLTFDGRTLLARALDLARAITQQVHIVGSAEKYATLAPVVEDIYPNCGPLGGIHAALRASQSELNVILAVDLPWVTPELLRFLITRARSCPALVTVPRSTEGWQPLCAVYRRHFADAAEKALQAGHYKIDVLFNEPQTQLIPAHALHSAGFSSKLFRNLNTPQDLSEATE
jgi:molybdopterin-guanine dinucleotide biosynthesis protein A